MRRERIILHGCVQGVGCRPFIHNLAAEQGLTGDIYNDVDGVTIEVQGNSDSIGCFIDTLRAGDRLPPLMKVTACHCCQVPVIPNEACFVIAPSDPSGAPSSHVTADSATCVDCIAEMNDPHDFRYRYPFINCTNCGPRYSIVKTIPYDRANTTMSPFVMCEKCGGQYTEVSDRRFHAQPVACPKCGPKIWLTDSKGGTLQTDNDIVIAKTCEMLSEGKIVAVKGLGGFHLACDAMNEQAVHTLRQRKNREHKPFAMMAQVDTINKFAHTDEDTIKLLNSPQSPVVLLSQRQNTKIARSIANGVNTYGFMLPYTPLHHLIFENPSIQVLVMTSANISDQPLICDNEAALEKLGGIADAFLMHDRVIYRQVDDSVIHVIDNDQAILRRSRGYTPSPILRSGHCQKQIFAAGADLKNTFCLGKGDQLLLSEHIGDLADGDVYRHYIRSVSHLQQLYEIAPEIVACDLHPGYFSTQYANTLGVDNIIPVQHHWAHIASVIAEHDYTGSVIGIVADGTGLGTDNAVWGGECLIASLTGFDRFAHLDYFPLAGGDIASKEPIRPVMGLLSLICEISKVPAKYSKLLKS
ncbi:MAG: carbamoyltransferase HypF, partial [Anaerohalosphaera sp.]|nr:carbamoyltransferase HypF [Anaerohalosphaera sp.]